MLERLFKASSQTRPDKKALLVLHRVIKTLASEEIPGNIPHETAVSHTNAHNICNTFYMGI